MMQNIFFYLYSYLYNKVITPISKRINVNNSICILFYGAVAPCVIGVFRNANAITVKYSNYVALKICYIIVLFSVKFKAYRCISSVAEVPFIVISVCLCCFGQSQSLNSRKIYTVFLKYAMQSYILYFR